MKEAEIDIDLPQCMSSRGPSSETHTCQQTQTQPLPQSPTKVKLRKRIKSLQMKLNCRNKKKQ